MQLGTHTLRRRRIAIAAALVTVAGTALSTLSAAPVLAAAPVIGGAGTFEYTEAAPPLPIGEQLTIANGVAYAGEYLEFSVGSSTASESLSLRADATSSTANGAVSIVGDRVYLGNGSTADNIGVVDAQRDGTNGKPLRVNFTNAFENPGFETGDLSSWTAVNSRVDLGVTSIANCPTVDNSSYAGNTPNQDNNVPSIPGTYTTTVNTIEHTAGNYSLQLLSRGITTRAGFDVVHGPAVFSDPFQAAAGDKIYFDWRAMAGDDAEHVFGYILDSTCKQTTVLNRVGDSDKGTTDWKTVETVIPKTDSYRFVFVSGTYDFTGGKAAGASLYIDNVRVYGTKATDDVAQQVARRIQYANASLDVPATRSVNLVARNSAGEQGSATITVNLTPLPEAPVYLDDTLGPIRYAVGYSDQVTTRAWPFATYAVIGTLPTGLTFDPVTATLSGTPAVPNEAYSFTITATNDSGSTPRTYSGNVRTKPFTFTDADTGQFLVGQLHGDGVVADGSPAPTYSVVSGNLPAGVSLDPATGALTGTPTTAGPYTFTIRATNVEGTLDQPFSGNVYSAPAFTDDVLPTFVTGTPYADGVSAAGVPSPTYSVSAGALPAGLTLNPTTGAVTGTPTAVEAPYSFTITATNVGGSASRSYSGTVNTIPRAFTDASLAQPYVGQPYVDGVSANGFPAPTYTVVAGQLPAGLVLDAATGAISGTPTTGGPYDVTIRATNSVGSVSQRLVGNVFGLPIFVDDQVAPFLAGLPFSDGVFAIGTPTPTYSITDGALPTGISLDPDTGAIVGTPTVPEEQYHVTITATNVAGRDQRSYSGTVEIAPSEYVDASIGQPVVGRLLQDGVTANGAQPPTYAVTSGSLPAGLVLDPATGAVTGTPTTAGPYSFWVTATNAHGSIAIRVSGTVATELVRTDVTIADFHAGEAYSDGVAASGLPAATYAVVSGTLPAGIALDPATGALTGTPTEPDAPYDFVIEATNLAGPVQFGFSGNVHAAPRGFADTELDPMTIGVPVTGGIAASGFPAPVYEVTGGALPDGVTLDRVTGMLSGTPTTGGPFTFQVTATNDDGSTVQTFTGGVRYAPTSFTDGQLAPFQHAAGYADALAADGWPAPRYEVSDGRLPTGVSLDPVTGALTGTPTVPNESYRFVVTARNAAGTTEREFSGTVQTVPVAPSAVDLGRLVVGRPAGDVELGVAVSPAPTYAISAGKLPAGLTLDPSTGRISGTPTAPGPYAFTVTIANSAGSVDVELRGTINPPDGGFAGLTPTRVVDTRSAAMLPAGSVYELDVRGTAGVPADATALALNVTVTDPSAIGYVTVYPCGDARPDASNLNFQPGETTSNAVIATIGAEGKVCVYTTSTLHLVVDVNGAYSPTMGFGQLHPLTPTRLYDSRQGATLLAADSVTRISILGQAAVPADATAAVLNVTATQPAGPGYLTVYPCGVERPEASNVNFGAGETVPNSVTAAIGSGGEVCVYASAATHLVVDLDGAYAPSAAGHFGSVTPQRVLDTRGGELPAVGAVQVIDLDAVAGLPADVVAVVLNVTIDAPSASGFSTVFPCAAGLPLASNLNFVAGQTVPNAVVTAVDADHDVCIYTNASAHVIADLNAIYTG